MKVFLRKKGENAFVVRRRCLTVTVVRFPIALWRQSLDITEAITLSKVPLGFIQFSLAAIYRKPLDKVVNRNGSGANFRGESTAEKIKRLFGSTCLVKSQMRLKIFFYFVSLLCSLYVVCIHANTVVKLCRDYIVGDFGDSILYLLLYVMFCVQKPGVDTSIIWQKEHQCTKMYKLLCFPKRESNQEHYIRLVFGGRPDARGGGYQAFKRCLKRIKIIVCVLWNLQTMSFIHNRIKNQFCIYFKYKI